ncbi:MAG: ABC transporter ATP-binding protein/permease [Pisciglobus halotolerans]|nr:ABC transporter ATP-binding protein/permease [Pisciglobus halotolerans]
MDSINWIWQYVKEYLPGWIGASLLTIAVALLQIITPYVGGIIVDRVIYGGEDSLLLSLLGIMLLGTAVRTGLRYSYQIKFEQISQNTLYQIREDLYVKLQELDFTFFNTTRVGDIMSRMTGDTEAIRHAVSWVYFNVLDNIVLFLSALIVLSMIEWRLTLALLVVTPFIALLTVLLSIKANGAFYEIRESFARLNSMVEENIGGNKVVKAFANEDYEKEKFDIRNEGFKKANMDSVTISRRYLPILETLAGFMSVISIGLGGYFVIRGSMSVGNLVAFNGLIWMLNRPMRNVGGYMNDMQRFITATYKIREMLNTKPLIPIERQKSTTPMKGKVEFQQVSFAFADDPEHLVLKDISFKVEAGQKVGILGETGSGKSTLVSLIARFFDPTEGRLLIDDEDIRNWNVIALRKQIAIVMQDVFLFSDTVRENIMYGSPSAPFEEVRDVAAAADASGFIEELPEQYDTYLGERGSGLSGGQRQRLSLARGLIKQPKVLILDDTTSAVDMETEEKIQKGMKDVGREETTFVIANRISSVKNADLILIMSKGEIIERGQHQELLANRGHYYEIYQEQLGQTEVEEDNNGSGTV